MAFGYLKILKIAHVCGGTIAGLLELEADVETGVVQWASSTAGPWKFCPNCGEHLPRIVQVKEA